MANPGRSPDGSGYSAEPEPGCTVSAVPVSIPNAATILLAEMIESDANAWLLVANYSRFNGQKLKALDEARFAAEQFALADTLRKRAAQGEAL